ncbi:MAG: hypothetical protein FWD85_03095 [Microbacteriaceae bacterium]|nr:hypothetical protein [Microbacteriaceae bacterium]MCL2794276.1 hypothetical protein [Microbacteriaceae bacterium]
MAVGYVRTSWWARNRVYIGCLIGVIGALAAVTVLVLGQTDVAVYDARGSVTDCGTLFAPLAGADCDGAHAPDLLEAVLSAGILIAAAIGVVLVVRRKPRHR